MERDGTALLVATQTKFEQTVQTIMLGSGVLSIFLAGVF